MFLTNFGLPGGSVLLARIRKRKKITVNILFIGAGNTKNGKEKCYLDHWDVFENRFEKKLQMVTNPNYYGADNKE